MKTSYHVNVLKRYVSKNQVKLFKDMLAYKTIFDSVRLRKDGLFYFDARSWARKPFVTKLLLAKVRKDKGITFAVASSGIAAAALLLSCQLICLPLKRPATSARGRIKLTSCEIIVKIECTMIHKGAL